MEVSGIVRKKFYCFLECSTQSRFISDYGCDMPMAVSITQDIEQLSAGCQILICFHQEAIDISALPENINLLFCRIIDLPVHI